MKFEGEVAIVTGGGGGIGQGIVHCLAEEGADVAVVDIRKDAANEVADEVRALDRKSLAIEADLADSKQVNQAVQKVMDTFGRIDILVNVAGGAGKITWDRMDRTSRSFLDQEEEAEWDEILANNLKSHVLMCRAVAPHFLKQKSGKIVNISSIAGKRPIPGMMSYGAAKAGDISLTRSLAMELAEHNINVNCICPGVVYTGLWTRRGARSPEVKGMTPREYFLKEVLPRVPLKREQTPEDFGRAVVFLVSEDARNITGQSLNLDGGMVMD